jgi:hypothetical protein
MPVLGSDVSRLNYNSKHLNDNRLAFTVQRDYLKAEEMMGQMQQIRELAEDYLV